MSVRWRLLYQCARFRCSRQVSPALKAKRVVGCPAEHTGDVFVPRRNYSGKQLQLEILSTWGDPHFVGLAGLDVFDAEGKRVSFSNPGVSARMVAVRVDVASTMPDFQDAISADPPDINVLPGYTNDPRTVDNLLDGVNDTCDDMHLWLAPFSAGMLVRECHGMSRAACVRLFVTVGQRNCTRHVQENLSQFR